MSNYFKQNAFMLTGQALSIMFMGAVMYATLKDVPNVEAPANMQVVKAQTLKTN